MFVSRYLRISLLAGFSLMLSLALLPADQSDANSDVNHAGMNAPA